MNYQIQETDIFDPDFVKIFSPDILLHLLDNLFQLTFLGSAKITPEEIAKFRNCKELQENPEQCMQLIFEIFINNNISHEAIINLLYQGEKFKDRQSSKIINVILSYITWMRKDANRFSGIVLLDKHGKVAFSVKAIQMKSNNLLIKNNNRQIHRITNS